MRWNPFTWTNTSSRQFPNPGSTHQTGRRNNYPPRDRDDRSDRDRGDRGGRGFSRDGDRDRQGSGSGGGRPKRDNRLIAERIELERQCRTLFVRNISVSPAPPGQADRPLRGLACVRRQA
jgi:hypothetical protein